MPSVEEFLAEDDRRRSAAMVELPVLRLRAHGRLTPSGDDGELTRVSIGPDGEAIALWRGPVPAITVQSGSGTETVRISSNPPAYAAAQPLPGGRFLVVAGRCRWRPEGAERNATVYERDGTVSAEHVFGDGIQHVLTTPAGEAWVGYFDEGVYGNYGWGSAGTERPIGAPGLIRFGSDGTPAWRFPADQAPPIDDCYALNVLGESAWACYYSDFPLVRVTGTEMTVWHNDVAGGATDLMVDGERAGLVGGYGDSRSRLAMTLLGDGELHDAGTFRLVLPDGEPLPAEAWTIARGPDLHVFHALNWYRIALADVA
ncbi:hypothetical protein [Actinoplanes sp. CA-252034]|uniref:hypothetical protein n=1 Tax=Actinoplanes sp. CA-252034 TaxID=3239906 RepID=UPI003D996994